MTPPDKIYLQVEPEPGHEITWCQDRINDSDVEYVNTELVSIGWDNKEHVDALVKRIRESQEKILAEWSLEDNEH